ncbi:hypothetical protein [Halorussus ruber]|uniref:hypothetical protein n=1 Tax=Halorussus ruber TaxID=1126238 RepID=UPI001091C455|nr:hypothetical protein [Halorussus ruber]
MTWKRWVPEPDEPPSESTYPDATCELTIESDAETETERYRLSTDGTSVSSLAVEQTDEERHRTDAAIAILPLLAGRTQGWLDHAVLLGNYATWSIFAYHLEGGIGVTAYDNSENAVRPLGIVKVLSLAETLRSYARAREPQTAVSPLFDRYLEDAERALEHYRTAGDLDSFRFKRSEDAIDAYLFSYQSVPDDPRTAAVVRDGECLAPRIEALSDSDDELARKRFIDLLYYHENPWVRRKTRTILAETPDERATDSLWLRIHDAEPCKDEEIIDILRLLSNLVGGAEADRLARSIVTCAGANEGQLIECCRSVSTPLTNQALIQVADWLDAGDWEPSTEVAATLESVLTGAGE